jgi:hypothetical protein
MTSEALHVYSWRLSKGWNGWICLHLIRSHRVLWHIIKIMADCLHRDCILLALYLLRFVMWANLARCVVFLPLPLGLSILFKQLLTLLCEPLKSRATCSIKLISTCVYIQRALGNVHAYVFAAPMLILNFTRRPLIGRAPHLVLRAIELRVMMVRWLLINNSLQVLVCHWGLRWAHNLVIFLQMRIVGSFLILKGWSLLLSRFSCILHHSAGHIFD